MGFNRYECGPAWDTRIITINPKAKVGILMSGGIDSWVLYNILKLDFSKPEIVIFNIKRGDGYDTAKRVKLLTGISDIIEVDELTTQLADYDSEGSRVSKGAHHIMNNYSIDELYLGTNIIPHTEYFPEFISQGKPKRLWSYREDSPFKLPLLHLYKYHIIDLANRNNIDLSQTQSCLHKLTEHCGKCWQCLEKQWAYKQLENIYK